MLQLQVVDEWNGAKVVVFGSLRWVFNPDLWLYLIKILNLQLESFTLKNMYFSTDYIFYSGTNICHTNFLYHSKFSSSITFYSICYDYCRLGIIYPNFKFHLSKYNSTRCTYHLDRHIMK